MKTLVLPVLAAALISFAAPAMAGGCSWGQTETTERPKPEEAQTS